MEARKESIGVKPYIGDPLDDEDARVALHNYITSISLKDGPRMSQSYQTLMSLMPSDKFIEFIMDEAIRSFSNKWSRIAKELFYLVLDFDPGYELAQQYIDTIQVYQSVSPQMTKKLKLARDTLRNTQRGGSKKKKRRSGSKTKKSKTKKSKTKKSKTKRSKTKRSKTKRSKTKRSKKKRSKKKRSKQRK